jgi:hypothetical protein
MKVSDFAKDQSYEKYLELEGRLVWSHNNDVIGVIHSVDIDNDRFPIFDIFWSNGRQSLSTFIHQVSCELIEL